MSDNYSTFNGLFESLKSECERVNLTKKRRVILDAFTFVNYFRILYVKMYKYFENADVNWDVDNIEYFCRSVSACHKLVYTYNFKYSSAKLEMFGNGKSVWYYHMHFHSHNNDDINRARVMFTDSAKPVDGELPYSTAGSFGWALRIAITNYETIDAVIRGISAAKENPRKYWGEYIVDRINYEILSICVKMLENEKIYVESIAQCKNHKTFEENCIQLTRGGWNPFLAGDTLCKETLEKIDGRLLEEYITPVKTSTIPRSPVTCMIVDQDGSEA